MKKLALALLLLLTPAIHAQTVVGGLADGSNLSPQGNATSGANFSSNRAYFYGSCWNGTTFILDTFEIQAVEGSGTNPTSTLTFTSPSGCSGVHAYSFDNAVTAPAFYGSTSGATGFAGLGTSTMAVAAPAGTGATTPVCATSVVCDSFSFTFTFTSGTGPTTGVIGTVTLPGTRTNVPSCWVQVRGGTAYLGEYTAPVNSSGTVTLPITVLTAIPVSTALRVIGGCFGI